MTAEDNKKFYLAQMPKGVDKFSNTLLEMAHNIFIEDIFKYKQGYNYAERIRNDLLKTAVQIDEYLKYIKNTPANKVFIDKDF